MNDSTCVLAIGVDDIICQDLEDISKLSVVKTPLLKEGIDRLGAIEPIYVLLNFNICRTPREDINSLLSITPVTTRILLLTPTTDIVQEAHFSALGVQSLTSPVSAAELTSYMQ